MALALRLVRESPAARAELQGRFRYVLVDEFQDTNRAQSELVSILAEPHRNVTVVGDDDQSIYRFRGAAISNILEFRDALPVGADGRPAPELPLARADPRRRPPARSGSTIRTGSRSGSAIAKRLPAGAGRRPAEPPVRLEAFASRRRGGGLDRGGDRRRIAAGARPADHAVLVRANAHADPILRSLNVAGIPWRFSGTSGLYARPEVRLLLAFLRAVADLGSSVDVYALATGEPYRLGGEDLTAIVNTARRRNRTLWEVLEELERQPGILRVSRRRPRTAVGAPRRRPASIHPSSPTSGRPARCCTRSCGTPACSPGSRRATRSAAEEALHNIARFFDIVRAQSTLLADDRASFVARHLQTLIEAGDDPPTADLDPDADAVAVLTVHKAKGLEFPVVFCRASSRAGSRRRPGASRWRCRSSSSARRCREGDFQLQEERRLFYVGMTRARDELVLTHAADYGGGRARRVSPFVLEALDLPPQAAVPGAGVPRGDRRSSGSRRGAARDAGAGAGAVGPTTSRSLLSFGAIDDYLTCPLKYKLRPRPPRARSRRTTR